MNMCILYIIAISVAEHIIHIHKHLGEVNCTHLYSADVTGDLRLQQPAQQRFQVLRQSRYRCIVSGTGDGHRRG